MPNLKPFRLTLDFDGSVLEVNYHDGSDKEFVTVADQASLEAAVLDHVRTALSEEEPEPDI